MSEIKDEQQRLRSVTIQTAESVFLARQRAEEELVRAKEALERRTQELAESVARLERSERELVDFFENAAVGLHWVGPDGVILRVNRAELEMLGYTREEYVGRHIAEFHVDTDVIEQLLRDVAAGQTVRERQARLRCKDGSIKHVLIDSSVLWDGDTFVHTRCFIRDVTGHRMTEAAQSRLAAIVESSEDAIIGKSLEGRILSWNSGAERLFQHTALEAVGQPITLIIPADRQDEERSILERLRRGERLEHYDTARIAKDGRRIDVSLTISPVRDASNHVVAASTIARDVTAKKRAERRLVAQYGVTQALAESRTLDEAAPRVLATIGEHLGWDVGALWYVDFREDVMRCSEVWHRGSIQVPAFEAATRRLTLRPGEGLPGRVWRDARPTWIADVVADGNFTRRPMAALDGLHGALGFPIVLGGEVLGVIEFFSPAICQPDPDLLEMMVAVGSQVGQLIERQQANDALRESEQRFRLVAENVPSMIWTADPDGTITYANERWVEYCGLTPLGNPQWPDVVLHPDDRPRTLETWSEALRQGTEYEMELRNRGVDGAYRWFVTRAVPLRDAAGRVVQWFGTTTDIDDRKRAEQTSRFLADVSGRLAELTDYESTLRQVADLAVPAFADWCVVEIQDGSALQRIAVAHPRAARMEEAEELFRSYPSRPFERHGARAVMRTGEPEWVADVAAELPVHDGDEPHLRALRRLEWKSYLCVPLRSRERTIGALTFAMAESGRGFTVNDLAAAEDLAHRASIAIENASLLLTLKETDRRKDEFLAMLAHELRNPLAPIRNAAQVFRAKAPNVPELRWSAEVVDRQVHQMTRLIDDLLDVSRITRGKIELRKERAELATIVNSAVEASRSLFEKWGHELTVEMPEAPIVLHADTTRLAQVVLNLLNNAAKYTDQGGRIRLVVERLETEALIRVQDNGIGIPRDKLTWVFEMFMQVDRSLERSEGGLGIGLTLVRRLVEMHGGTVEARSEGPGRGSEFLVRLPLARSERIAGGGEGASAPPRTAKRRILVVDDNRDAADSLGVLLGIKGHEVQTAHDGLEAVGAAAAFRPDVVLMDIGLPKLNGYEVARRIREQEDGERMLLIAVTGWGQEEDRRRSRDAGFDHHMTKPVEFSALERLLAESDREAPDPRS